MNTALHKDLPPLFRRLAELDCLREEEIHAADDGFWAADLSLSGLLGRRGITSLPGEKGRPLECSLFFDDWYLYGVASREGHTCSLFKMREQEDDAKRGLHADGDNPGVTVSFIAMDGEPLLRCLTDPDEENRRALAREINRVAAAGGQRHSEALKEYFVRTEALAPYLIAGLYTGYIASLASSGSLPVPERYAADYQKQGGRGRTARLVEEHNRAAGYTVCDHERIYIRDPHEPTLHERLAILATHGGNGSFHSFAAEIRFHARFLTPWARIPIPFLGRSAYASAIRADISIADGEFTGPTPYHRPNSAMVKAQRACHRDPLPFPRWKGC